MTGTKWLSEAIDITTIQKGVLNIVEAPTGCGKTEWAFKDLTKMASDPNKILYLIDTTIGKQSLLKRPDTIYYSDTHIETVKGNWFSSEGEQILIMTYAQFGYWVLNNKDFWKAFEIIVCDEIHNLVNFSFFNQSDSNFCRIAREQLEKIVCGGEIIVIGLTATPSKVEKHMLGSEIHYVVIDKDIKQYEVSNTVYYTNIDEVLRTLDAQKTGIIYTGRITRMKNIHEKLVQHGVSSICIWSINSQNHIMNDEQLAARDYIISKEELPPNYKAVIINDSCGTCINIRGSIDYMMIHSQEDDTRIQVRGRYRDDLDTLYLLDHKAAAAKLTIPKDFLDKWLSKQDRDELCKRLGIRDNQNRLVGWTTTKKRIAAAGYKVDRKRIKNIWHYEITL